MKKFWKHFMNWKILLSFGISWLICNGWAFAAIVLGQYFDIQWLAGLGAGWIAILMLPNGFGILVPMPLALLLQSILFPNDDTLKNLLLSLKTHIKEKVKANKEKRKAKKENEDIIIDENENKSGI